MNPNRCALPGDTLLAGQDTEELPAVQQADEHADGDVPPAALDDAAHQEHAELAEDDPAGADDHGVRVTDEPDPDPG